MIFSILKLFLAILLALFATIECEVCQTDVCKKLSYELKKTMDNSFNPCDDFSSYICENFNRLHSIPLGENQFSTMGILREEVMRDISRLLYKQSMSNKNDAKYKAKIFYESCIDLKTRNRKEKATITELAGNVIKEKGYEANLIKALRSNLNPRMISIRYSRDPINTEYNLLYIDEPTLLLSSQGLQSPNSQFGKAEIDFYKKDMLYTLKKFDMWKKERQLIDEIFALHTKIAKALPIFYDKTDIDANMNKITIKDLQSRCNQISWKNLINGVLKGTGKTFGDNDIIVVFSLNYIDGLCAILKEYNSVPNKKRVLEMDLQWAAITSVMDAGLADETNVKKICGELTSTMLSDIIGHMYISNLFQASQKKDFKIMMEEVRKSLKDVLDKSSWMDSKTKEEALKKLSTMKFKIAFPDSLLSETQINKDNENVIMVIDEFLKNVITYKEHTFLSDMKDVNGKIPDDRWFVNVQDANAFYNRKTNEIVFPASILRYPYYDIGLPPSVNFGGIGTVFGHEIIHAFDTKGSKYDERGLLRDWWTKSTRDEYKKRTDCIYYQYSAYSYNKIGVMAKETLDENIADNGGIRMAYKAAFSDDKRKHLTLPGLDFTPEQLFFVNNAKTYCSVLNKAGIKEEMRGNDHGPWKFRINGPMSNMPEFSKAFKCDQSEKMNPLKKCLVW